MKTIQDNKKIRLNIPVLAGLMACTSLSTDIYLPAMPTIEKELGGNAEFTITGFLIGFALAQLVWGPISDRIGRKKPLLIGMLIFALGAAGCALAGSIRMLVLCRVIQACGACVGPMLSRSMVSDVCTRDESAKTLSILMMILAVSPILAPLLGAFLTESGAWRSIFWILSGFSMLLFICVLGLDETLPEEKRSTEPVLSRFKSFGSIMGNRAYLRYLMCVFFFTTAIYAFVTASSYVYIEYFHIDSKYYAVLFGINMVGVVITSNITRTLAGRVSLDRLLKISTLIALFGGALLLASALTGLGSVYLVVAAVFIICSMNGFISSCCNAAALSSIQSTQVGAASSLLGAFQYGSGVISSAVLAVFSTHSPIPMAIVMAAFIILSALSMRAAHDN